MNYRSAPLDKSKKGFLVLLALKILIITQLLLLSGINLLLQKSAQEHVNTGCVQLLCVPTWPLLGTYFNAD